MAKEKEKIKQKSSADKEIFAKTKYIRVSAKKLRRVANIVRGKSIVKIMPTLKNLPHKGAKLIYKTIKSAVANAENNNEMSSESLFLTTLLINEGPQFKRFRARARGRVFGITKKTSHIVAGVCGSKGEK